MNEASRSLSATAEIVWNIVNCQKLPKTTLYSKQEYHHCEKKLVCLLFDFGIMPQVL